MKIVIIGSNGFLGTKASEILSKKHEVIKAGKRTNKFFFVLPEDMDVEIPEYAGRMNYSFKFKHNDTLDFRIVKKAPLIHKNKISEKLLYQMLMRLSWKHYRLLMDLTKNGKYQLNQ